MPTRKAFSAEQWYGEGGKGFIDSPEDRDEFDANAEFADYGEVSDHYSIWEPYKSKLYLPFLAVIKAEDIEKGISGDWTHMTRNVNPWP